MTGLATTGTSPSNTSPVEPSRLIMSPSRTTWSPTRATRCAASMSISSAPTTAVRPIPRATTAAWEVLPPRAVRIPVAAIIPPRSSGLVSLRTRTTRSPAAARRTASALSNTAAPVAAPGEAAMPRVRTVRSPGPNCGNMSWASCSPLTRVSASSMVMRCSSTSWVAIRNAAVAVRLPTRVCSIHRVPRSTVNSMSQRSR